MKRPHRESGRGDGVKQHADSRDPSPKALTRQTKWQAKNPQARWAHVCLQSALRRGLIERQPCSVCGDEKVDGHHPDYDRPMFVIWYCRKHHKDAHKRGRGNG